MSAIPGRGDKVEGRGERCTGVLCSRSLSAASGRGGRGCGRGVPVSSALEESLLLLEGVRRERGEMYRCPLLSRRVYYFWKGWEGRGERCTGVLCSRGVSTTSGRGGKGGGRDVPVSSALEACLLPLEGVGREVGEMSRCPLLSRRVCCFWKGWEGRGERCTGVLCSRDLSAASGRGEMGGGEMYRCPLLSRGVCCLWKG